MGVIAFRSAHSENGRLLPAIVLVTQDSACDLQFELNPMSITHDQNSMNQKPIDQNHDVMLPRPVRDSQSEMSEIVLPNDANPLGALLGGRLMHWIDLAGAMAAHRHARNYVVTAAIDHMDFWVPVHVGDLVILRSSVNRVFRTSMEVGVKVWVENYIADDCHHVGSAYLTFVAIDAAGRHVQVPAVIPETDDQRRRYDDAGRRREIRRTERERRKSNRR
jgi:acyl-CoA hydrolase